MKVKCISNFGGDVPEYRRGDGECSETNYRPFVVGGLYVVFGVMFEFNRVRILACPDKNGPCWAPLDLFEVIDSAFSEEIRIIDMTKGERFSWLSDSVIGMIGYPELIESEDHFIGIIERDEKELGVFFRKYYRPGYEATTTDDSAECG